MRDKLLRGLYVHIPFCSVKCFYCDFTAFAGQRAQVTRYLKALAAEAASRRAALPLGGAAVDTFYAGGGTPSELSAEELSELLRLIEAAYGPISAMAEATLEANPDSVDEAKLDALARGGVRRLSLGLQTMEPRLLREIGRRHSVDDFLRAFAAARRRGFALNVDLMYGLPTQTLEESLASLDAVLRLEPEHLSLYGLQVEDRTLFAKRGVEADEDLGREMFERALDRLASAGFRHYEISNFARPGFESIHNQIYWKNGEYIGLGCGASGYLSGRRYSNVDRLADYCGCVEAGKEPAAEAEALTGKERLGETVLLGLRMIEGLVVTEEMATKFKEEFAHACAQGWLEIDRDASGSTSGGIARLTREGIFLANRVFEEFVPPFRTASIS